MITTDLLKKNCPESVVMLRYTVKENFHKPFFRVVNKYPVCYKGGNSVGKGG